MEEVDCITCEPIRADRRIIIKEGDNTYHFDVMTLYKNSLRTKQHINPFTKQPLRPEVNRQVRIYGEQQKTVVNWKHEIIPGNFSMTLDSFLTIGDLFLEILRNTSITTNAKIFPNYDGISSFLDCYLHIFGIDFYTNLDMPLENIVSKENTLECILHPGIPRLDSLYRLENFLLKRSSEPYTLRLFELLSRRIKKVIRQEKTEQRDQNVKEMWWMMRHIADSISPGLTPEISSDLQLPDFALISQIISFDDLHILEILLNNCACLDAENFPEVLKLLTETKYPHVNKYLDLFLDLYSVNGKEKFDPSIFKMVADHLPSGKRAKKNQKRILKILLLDREKLEVIALDSIKNPHVRDFMSRN